MTYRQMSLLGVEQQAHTSDDFYTPRWIFDAMGITFDLDVACPPEGPMNVPAARYFTAADDGLAQPWEGRVWMNPPYSRPAPWVDRFLNHRNGVALTPSAKSAWCYRLWESEAACVMLPPRWKFVQGPIYMPTMLWAFGDECIAAIQRVGHAR